MRIKPTPRRSKILVVDDQLAFAELTAYHLEHSGKFEARCANQCDEAIRIALEWIPDMVLLDYLLGDPLATSVFERFQVEPKLAGIPILIMSGSGDIIDRERDRSQTYEKKSPQRGKLISREKLKQSLNDTFARYGLN